MITTYGYSESFGGKTYGASGYGSEFEAKLSVYERAYGDGYWRPPLLREKWWQFWRPKRHNEIEAYFAARDNTSTPEEDAEAECLMKRQEAR